ncbi:Uncharacterised protein [Vibrio cholerae]|nr:Uncharacterised protein [Vibrio cholerae]CSD58087.1 Uncharacterised protein [Vibrio cholerae]CSI79218.1 Uncharacterised protein [Vibrio cholerae]
MLFPLRIGTFCAVHYDKVWFKVCQLFFAWTNEHVFHKVCLPCYFGDEANT